MVIVSVVTLTLLPYLMRPECCQLNTAALKNAPPRTLNRMLSCPSEAVWTLQPSQPLVDAPAHSAQPPVYVPSSADARSSSAVAQRIFFSFQCVPSGQRSSDAIIETPVELLPSPPSDRHPHT